MMASMTGKLATIMAQRGEGGQRRVILGEGVVQNENAQPRTFHCQVLSEIHWQSGHHEDAQTLAVETCERARENKERGHEANTLRLLGDIAIYRQPLEIDEAKTHYQQALNLAHELGWL